MSNVMTGILRRIINPCSWDANGAGQVIGAAIDGQLSDIDRLASEGANLAGLTCHEAACFLTVFANRRTLTDNDSNGEPREFRHLKGSALAKARLAHHAELGPIKQAIWQRMIELKLPLANFDLPSDPAALRDFYSQLPDDCVPTAAWAYALEAKRGGFLQQDAFLQWARLQFALDSDPAGAAACSAPLGHKSALEFAAQSGMPCASVPKACLAELIALQGDGCPIDGALAFLASQGCKLSGDEPIVHGYNGLAESLIGRLLHIGASPHGIHDAAKIGADLFALDGEGRCALETLYSLDRAGRYAERAAALLDAAEGAVPGAGRGRMLAMRGKAGSGPLHWAGRALCPESVGLFADLGLDPNEKDSSGKTAGHWAAKKYGAKKADKAGPTLAALSRAGQRWDELDNKGASALAELAKKAPLDPVAALLDEQPQAALAKTSRSPSAIDALRNRQEERAKALADKADLRAALPGECPAATKNQRKLGAGL